MTLALAEQFLTATLRATDFYESEEESDDGETPRVACLVQHTLEESYFAVEIGRMAGRDTARRLCAVSRQHGAGMRASIALLQSYSLPELYVCGGQVDIDTVATVQFPV